MPVSPEGPSGISPVAKPLNEWKLKEIESCLFVRSYSKSRPIRFYKQNDTKKQREHTGQIAFAHKDTKVHTYIHAPTLSVI